MRLSLGTRGMRLSMVAMGFHPGSLVLSAPSIREDKEASFCPFTAIEEQRASQKAKQKTLMCRISLPIYAGISKLIVYRSSTPGKSETDPPPNERFAGRGRKTRGTSGVLVEMNYEFCFLRRQATRLLV